jgi:dihydrolipoamide dehydrogenase
LASSSFDLVVIGSGPGGYVAAIRAGKLGLSTAVIEKAPKFGGTCLHWGCIPTKVLLHTADLLGEIRHAGTHGIKVADPTLDLAAVMKRKQQVVDGLSQGVQGLMKKNKVTLINGHGKLAGKGKVAVLDAAGKVTQELTAKNIILATGSVIREFPGMETDGKVVINSDNALSLPEVPKTMVVIGAGAVGVEFASIYMRYGSKVTLIELMPRILPIEDPEVSEALQASFVKQGMQVFTATKVQSVKKTAQGAEVTVQAPDGKEQKIQADLVLVAIGRRPVSENLGLEGTRIQLEKGFVKVNGYMETGEPGVYAIGDLVPTPLLAHTASAEGLLAVARIAGKEAHPLPYDHTPNCTYCWPQVASAGLTEAKAKERGYDVMVGKFPFKGIGKAAIVGDTDGFVKVVVDKKYDQLLGVHMIGPCVTDMIAEAVVALGHEATGESLSHAVHPHPTLSEAVMEAAEAVYGLQTHW